MTARRRWHVLPRPTVADRGVLVLVSVLSLFIVVGTAAASAWLHTTADTMAADTFGQAPHTARQVYVYYAEVRDSEIPADAAETLDAALAPDLAELLGPPKHAVVVTEAVVEALPKQPQYSPSFLSVAALPDARELVRIVEGSYPRPGTTEVVLPRRLAATYDGPRRVPVIEVALERSAAEAMDIGVGAYLDLVPRRYSPDAPERLTVPRVSGLYEATAPYPSPLDDLDNLRRPAISELPELSVVRAAALAADEQTVLQAPWPAEPEVRWTFDPDGVPTAEEAEAVVDDARLLAVQPWPPVHESAASTAVTKVGDLATAFVEQRRASDTLAALVLAALAAAALALLVAAAAVLEARRREVADVLRARGAGTGQLVLLRGGEALLVVLPGLLVVAALLLWGPVAVPDVVPALVAATACAVLLTAAQVAPWRRLPERVRLPARDALQIVTVLLALGIGAVLLTRDSLTATDPLLLTFPALVGAAGAVLVVRGVRLATALLRSVAVRGRRLTSLVGISQAAATAQHVTLPVVAVVLGLASALLATAVDDTLQRGADRAAWARLGADVRVSEARIDQAQLERLRQLPGVAEAAPVYSVEALLHTVTGRQPVRVLAVDAEAFADATARGPEEIVVPRSSGDEVTALASSDLVLEDAATTLQYAQAEVPLRVTTRTDVLPGVTDGESFVLVDVAAFRAAVGRSLLRAETVLVVGEPDPAEVARVVHAAWPTAVVMSRSQAAEAALDESVASRTLAVARAGVVGSAAVAVLAAALAVALGGPLRRRTRAVLHALGTEPRQARWVSALEVLPAMVASALVAMGAAVLLMAVVGKGASLDALTGAETGSSLAPAASSWLGAAALLAGGIVLLTTAVRTGRTSDVPGTTHEGGTR